MFRDTSILIENSLEISNGIINGHPVINSTILDNCTINYELSLGSIILHDNMNLTLRNVWKSNLMIILVDNSTATLYNCSLGGIYLQDSTSVIIHNSSIQGISEYGGSILIDNNSKIFFIQITSYGQFEIRQSAINYIHLINFQNYFMKAKYKLDGYIANSSIENIYCETYGFLNIYRSSIKYLTVRDQSKVFLNETTVSQQLNYGIKLNSGYIEYINGTIYGSNFFNNTLMRNSYINKTILDSISLNNTASIQIINYTGNLYLHDSAIATIINTTIIPSYVYAVAYQIDGISINANTACFFILDSSQLIVDNSNITFLYAMGNSSLSFRANSIIGELILKTLNSVDIDNSTIEKVYILSESIDTSYNISIYNSYIKDLHVNPTSITYIENCLIDNLYEGFYMDLGDLTWDHLGITGIGSYKNKTILVNSIIITRSLRYIRLMNSAKLSIKNIFNDIKIFTSESAVVNIENSRICYIDARDSSQLFIRKCESFQPSHFGENLYSTINLYDDSKLFLDDNWNLVDMTCIMQDSSVASIDDSSLNSIFIGNYSIATVVKSQIFSIYVEAYNEKDYSLKLYDSEVVFLFSVYYGL